MTDIKIRRLRYNYEIMAVSEVGLKWMREHFGNTGAYWMDRLHYVHWDHIQDIMTGMLADDLIIDD